MLTTLQVGAGSQLVPVACAIALRKRAPGEELPTGLIGPDAAGYAMCRDTLDAAITGVFVRFYRSTWHAD